MSTAALRSTPEPPAATPAVARVVAIVAGALLATIAAALLLGGGAGLWAHTTQRDGDGWFASPWHHFDTATRAITAEGLQLGDVRGGPEDWFADFGSVRVRARRADGGSVFVGIAPEAGVDASLRGVAHTEVHEVRWRGYGAGVPTRPARPAAGVEPAADGTVPAIRATSSRSPSASTAGRCESRRTPA